MHDFRDDFEMDKDGRLRRKRTARDGERITFATISDQACGFSPTFSDGTIDHTSPHRPGFRFADVGDEAKLRAEGAYRERSRRMADAWRQKGDAPAEHTRDTAPPQRTASLDEARAAADAAYEQRRARLHYRHRQQDALATERPSPRTLDAAQLADAAQRAYDERSRRMQSAWKHSTKEA